MPGDQFPPGPEEGPENAQFSDSEHQPDDSGELAPIGASTPGEWPVNPEEEDVDLPGGGQYPDDMFGSEPGGDAPVALPGEAFAGGLADVEYGDAAESAPPLPPPAEPQELTEISIDPLPVSEDPPVIAAEPAAPGGDMFSVDELMGEPADAEPAPGGDMFSVDDLMGDDADAGEAPPPAAKSPAPLAIPLPDDIDEPLASAEPLPLPDAEFVPEPLATPDVSAAETPEPLAVPEPLAAPESFATPEPLAMPETSASPDPVAEFDVTPSEPPAAVEPAAEEKFTPPSDLSVPGDDLSSPDPIEHAEPVAAAEAAAPDEPPVLGPHGITDSQAETPASDFGFTGIGTEAAAADAVEPLPVEALEPPSTSEPIANTEIVEMVAEEPVDADVVNPYAEVSDEADVVDPSMSAGAGFELQNTDLAEGETVEIVNPYAEVSDEAEVIDPAMALSESAPVEPEAPPEVFTRTEIEYEQQAVPADAAPEDPFAAPPEGVYDESSAMPAAYGEMSYENFSSEPLPETDRTVSIAPPGMENFETGGILVAGAKGKAKTKAKKGSKSKNGGGGKRSFGKGKKGKQAAAAPQPDFEPMPESAPQQPPVAAQHSPGDVPVAAMMPELGVTAEPVAGQAFADVPPAAQIAPEPLAAPAGFTDAAAAQEMPMSQPQPAKAKGGKSFADTLLGKVEPGQRHKLFGIPVGKPAPIPGEVSPTSQATAQPLPAADMPAPAVPAAMLTSQQTVASAAIVPPAGPVDEAKPAKRGRKQKSPKSVKQPKAPKNGQGKSFADTLLGEVEPGQRHKLFGIPVGKPAPIPGAAPTADQVLPAADMAQSAADAQILPPAAQPVYEQPLVEQPPAEQPAYGSPLAEQSPAEAPVFAAESVQAPPEAGLESAEVSPEAPAPVEPQPQQPPAAFPQPPQIPAADAPVFPPPPPVQSPVASLTPPPPPPPAATTPVPPPAGAEVIETLEAAAHKLGGSKRGRKQKRPKSPKPPKQVKDKQGKSFVDVLLGEVEPGQRHKLFGIPVGKPVPMPGETRNEVPPSENGAAQFGPGQDQQAPAPDADHGVSPQVPNWPPPPPAAEEPPPPAAAPAETRYAPPPADPSAATSPGAYPPSVAPQYIEPPVQSRPAASAAAGQPSFSSPAFPVAQPEHAATAVLDRPAVAQPVTAFQSPPATADPAQYGTAAMQAAAPSSAQLAAQPQHDSPAAIPMQATTPGLASAPVEIPTFKLARWAARASAQVVDLVIVAGVMLLIGRFLNFGPLAENGVMQGNVDIAGVALAIVIAAGYQSAMLAYAGGQTLGKRVAKIRVVREDGDPIDLGYAMLREGVVKLLPAAVTAGVFGLVDAAWPVADAQNRSLHDRIVKSRVVEE